MKFALIDLRCHGHSRGFQPPHTLDACVGDLMNFARETDLWPSAMMGHSLGGKVLMQLAKEHEAAVWELQEHSPKLTIAVLDSTPGRGPAAAQQSNDDKKRRVSLNQPQNHQEHNATRIERDTVMDVLRFIETAPLPIPSRATIVNMCTAYGLSPRVGLWLASNLTRLEHHGEMAGPNDNANNSSRAAPGYKWLFDPAGAAELFESHNAIDCWDILIDGPPKDVHLHLVMAEKSSRWNTVDARNALDRVANGADSRRANGRGSVHLHTVHNAGHWLHVDNPDGTVDVLSGILTDVDAMRDSQNPRARSPNAKPAVHAQVRPSDG